MYTTVLTLHSWLRWLALVAGVGATIAAARNDTPAAASGRVDRWGLVLTIALDTQLLLGLALYFFLSPTTAKIREDFGAAMRDPVARFWAVEHLTMMLGAVVAAHVGRVLGRKSTAESRKMKLFVCYGIATALMILGTPWPGFRAGRALFRGL
jgi:hypothetical protein